MKHIRSEEQCASFLIYAVHDVTRLGKRLASPEILEEDSLFTQIGEVVMSFFRNSSLKETSHSCRTMYRQCTDKTEDKFPRLMLVLL